MRSSLRNTPIQMASSNKTPTPKKRMPEIEDEIKKKTEYVKEEVIPSNPTPFLWESRSLRKLVGILEWS